MRAKSDKGIGEMNRKNIPLVLMLSAGAVTCIITFIQQHTMVERLAVLLAVLVLFYLLGSVLVWTLNYFEMQNEQKLKEEGEVIEKETDETDGDQDSQKAQSDREEQEGKASDEEEA